MKICRQCKKEVNTNGNYCDKCGTQLTDKKKRDGFNILSIISLSLIAVVLLLIAFGLILTISNEGNPAVGFVWAFMVIIPSIPLLIASLITAIIPIISYFVSISKKNKVDIKKTVLVIVNIMQIILIVIGLIVFVNWWNKEPSPTDEGLEHNIESINEMFIESDEKYAKNDLSIDNVHKFDQLLSYVDSVVGKENYYIASLYMVENPIKYENTYNYDDYIVKIIPKDYIEQYNSWKGGFSSNPYLIMFTMETDSDIYYESHIGMDDNYYETFILGMKYKEEVKKEFASINSKYEYLVDYNPFLHISKSNLGVDSNSDLLDGIDLLKTKSGGASLLIIAPYGTSKEEGQELINNNKEIFNKYYIKSVSLCVLKENEIITDYINISKYNSQFENYYLYSIN